ncbi:hypothetical protein IPM09_02330 [Candidatus Saccharibacteria bacterium]|nr:MAG: hypothetical protein IPM09_02330 [Candidatus Saccharibacteria bacterium]
MRNPASEHLPDAIREELLQSGIVSGDFILASGIRAAKKFDFDLIPTNSDLFEIVVSGLARCIRNQFSSFDAIVTIANGATRLGDPIAHQLNVSHTPTTYHVDELGQKQFVVPQLSTERHCIIVDDVFTKGTNATKVASRLAARGCAIGGVGVILDRSNVASPAICHDSPVVSLIKQQLL